MPQTVREPEFSGGVTARQRALRIAKISALLVAAMLSAAGCARARSTTVLAPAAPPGQMAYGLTYSERPDLFALTSLAKLETGSAAHSGWAEDTYWRVDAEGGLRVCSGSRRRCRFVALAGLRVESLIAAPARLRTLPPGATPPAGPNATWAVAMQPHYPRPVYHVGLCYAPREARPFCRFTQLRGHRARPVEALSAHVLDHGTAHATWLHVEHEEGLLEPIESNIVRCFTRLPRTRPSCEVVAAAQE